MATTIIPSDLTVTISESYTVNGVSYGNTMNKTYASNGQVSQRVMNIAGKGGSGITFTNILALSTVNNESFGKSFDIGCGVKISVNTLSKQIIKLSNSESKIEHTNERVGDIKASYADMNISKKLINYEPISGGNQSVAGGPCCRP